MFASKAGAYPSVAFLDARYRDRLLVLPANIKLVWKNRLAYHEHLKITDVKSFIASVPGLP